MLFDGEHIGKTLGWVKFISETVPDGDASVFGELFDSFVGKTTEFDAVKHASKHEGGVTD